MSEVIQQLNVPAKTTIVREFPELDLWSDDSFLIKFGDFEVQVMDKNMETIKVFLDDHIFFNGKLIKGSPGDSFSCNKNNHHSITADVPLPPTATSDGHSTDQGHDLQKHTHSSDIPTAYDLQKSVSLCNQTIADLIDKNLLKFTKSKLGFFKKQMTTFSQEREEVIKTLHRLSEQSRQVVKNEDNIKRQLGIKQRNQLILEKIIKSFGKELGKASSQILELENQLVSSDIKCQEFKENIQDISSMWAEKFKEKDTECQIIRKDQKIMAQLLEEKTSILDDVTKELSDVKEQMKLLKAANGVLAAKNTVLLNSVTKEKETQQKVFKAKERLRDEKESLESGIKMMEAKMKQQRQFYEEQINKMKEGYEMELIKMKTTNDAEIEQRDQLLQNLCNQLAEEKLHNESLQEETALMKTLVRDNEKQNEALKKEMKLVKGLLDLVTDERAKLIESQEEQVGHLHNEIKILKEKFMNEEKRRKTVEDLHQHLILTKKTEEDRFMVCQIELFLKSCVDNAVLLDETTKIQKNHLQQAEEANRRCTHLQQNNEQLQKKVREANQRYSILYEDFEKLKNKLRDVSKKMDFRGEMKDRQPIPPSYQIQPLPRIKELECELEQKVKEQEDMRVLIKWLKKDLSKTEKDLAHVTLEKKDLIKSIEKEQIDHNQVINGLKKTFAEEKLLERRSYEMRDNENRRLVKEMTDLYQQLKIGYKDLQKSKTEADKEIERLKDDINEMEDELDEMDEELENCDQDIEELEDDLDDAEYEIEQKEKEIRKLKTQVQELLKTKKNLEKKLRSFQLRA
ncbi:hypothetical protein HOLleu_16146 [Holothuria leucospilota]|uniref:Uncharacterized protein n=1 Tax=Holothuria leucospilota TaxID=206669 RepID=A0A9Q1C5P7_HOLLE|nr:hypothetical protein HOLleu_16146 [Holothuria leucospilota]